MKQLKRKLSTHTHLIMGARKWHTYKYTIDMHIIVRHKTISNGTSHPYTISSIHVVKDFAPKVTHRVSISYWNYLSKLLLMSNMVIRIGSD